jgi:hypothetical protein
LVKSIRAEKKVKINENNAWYKYLYFHFYI